MPTDVNGAELGRWTVASAWATHPAVLVSTVALFGAARTASVLFDHAFPVGIDGYFYTVQVENVRNHGVPVHELQLRAGHASITSTQHYINARASSLAESMRQARPRPVTGLVRSDEASVEIG
jgi:hypothetical protein